MSSFFFSIKLATALVSGSDTGPVPQNVKSWQFLDAPIPGMHRKTQKKASGSQFRTDRGQGLIFAQGIYGWNQGLLTLLG